MLSMHELSLSMTELMLSLNMLILAKLGQARSKSWLTKVLVWFKNAKLVHIYHSYRHMPGPVYFQAAPFGAVAIKHITR